MKRTALNSKLPPRRKLTAVQMRDILARQGNKCACGCGEELTDPRDIRWDHRLPLWAGGLDHPDNIDALKVKHHASKTSGEAAALAKVRRIVAGGSHRRRNLSAKDKQLEKLLQDSHAAKPPTTL